MIATTDGMQAFCLFVIPAFSLLSVLAVGVTRRHTAQPSEYEDPEALANRLVKECTIPLTPAELAAAMDSTATVTGGPYQP